MRKLTIQGIGILGLFFFTWFALSEVDWMKLFNVNHVTRSTEEKLGELFWDWFKKAEKEVENEKIIRSIDSILVRICDSNYIDKTYVKMHIVVNEEVNAFALPDEHLILYTGLLKAARNESELSGVICHELAHMQLNHVTKKLIKETGLSVLISMTTGNNAGDLIKEEATMLSSTAYDRKLEKEADIVAADYLIQSGLSPVGYADFLSRLSENYSDAEKNLTWISTHPESKKRAEYIREHRTGEPQSPKAILSEASWNEFKAALNENP